MTITTPIHQYVRKDRETDRGVDVQTDPGKAGGKDGRAGGRAAFVIVLANHKGGVTKTTSTANLGALCAELVEGEVPGLRILGGFIAASEQRWRVTRDAAYRMTADQMRVLPASVPRTVRVASAPRYRAPTAVPESDSMVSHAYRQLARLLLSEIER